MARSEPSPPEALEAAYAYAADNDCAPLVWAFESWRRLIVWPDSPTEGEPTE